MKTAVYLRCSSASQTLKSQRHAVNRWLKGHGIEDVTYFTDEAKTGTNLNRDGLQALQASVFAGEVDTIVVFRLDRVSRSLKDGIATLCDWLDRGIRVVSVAEQFDFSGATGKLIMAVLVAVAEMETQTRAERQAEGIAVAKASGVYKGRKVGAYKLKDAPAKARELKARGLSDAEIAKILGVSPSTAWRYLKFA